MAGEPVVPRLVLASANPGKLREFGRLLADVVGEVVAQADMAVKPAPEPHLTFVENALSKARAAAQATGLPALADDSGLCVSHLDGAPGVQSARFAGAQGDDEANNDLLLELMAGCTDRAAHYHCSLVLCRHANDPCPLIAEGRWHGAIATERSGSGGFGYDPLFDLGDGRTAAQLDPADKDKISHRGKAVGDLVAKLRSSA
jgi:XTP/dITP diphosphohydrolase